MAALSSKSLRSVWCSPRVSLRVLFSAFLFLLPEPDASPPVDLNPRPLRLTPASVRSVAFPPIVSASLTLLSLKSIQIQGKQTIQIHSRVVDVHCAELGFYKGGKASSGCRDLVCTGRIGGACNSTATTRVVDCCLLVLWFYYLSSPEVHHTPRVPARRTHLLQPSPQPGHLAIHFSIRATPKSIALALLSLSAL